MKMKRWLSRGIVLAMVVALMMPMPVAAKGGKAGGKLVKSVTEYSYQNNRWEKESKTTYTYDKKNNPAEITDTYYYNHVLGIPMGASNQVSTAKYKYKGKTPKSMKLKNTAGVVTETNKYKKGRVVNYTNKYVESYWKDDNTEIVESTTSTGVVSYNKKGLAVSLAKTSTTTYSDGRAPESTSGTTTYTVTHKKGVPSLIVAAEPVTYEETTYDSEGNETGTQKVTKTESSYTKFNGKGLAVESGSVDSTTGAYKAYNVVEYTKKKGNIKQAVVYRVDSQTGAKTPLRMYKFKYEKKKISAERYLNMMNSIIGYHNAFFSWY